MNVFIWSAWIALIFQFLEIHDTWTYRGLYGSVDLRAVGYFLIHVSTLIFWIKKGALKQQEFKDFFSKYRIHSWGKGQGTVFTGYGRGVTLKKF